MTRVVDRSADWFALLVGGFGVVGGAVLRLKATLASSFPVNDGGMFFVMAQDIWSSGMSLPAFSSYNGGTIPFAYPPLGIYAVAVATHAGISPSDVLRFLPPALSIATIPLVFLITRRILGRDELGAVAVAFYALSLGSYQWLVMGGGVTRALGFLSALGAVYFAVRMYQDLRRWSAVACGTALGATALSHPQAAVFGALSVILLLPFIAVHRGHAGRNLLTALVFAGLAVIPWLVTVILHHGFTPFASAIGTGGGALLGVFALASSRTSGSYLEVIGVATSFGLVICAVRRFWLPVIWILGIAAADSRAGQPYLSVPAAIAVAFLISDLGRVAGNSRTGTLYLVRTRLLSGLAIGLVGLAFADSLATQSLPGSPLRTLSAETRDAMMWVEGETEPDASFVVVSGWYWALDAEAEWFPALAGRRSVATVQGSEWQGRYSEQVQRAGELPACIVADNTACIEHWFKEAGPVDYLFLVDTPTKELGGVVCCHQLAGQVERLYETEIVHREGPVLIVRLAPRSF